MSDSNKMKYYILADHTGFEKGVNKSIAIAKKGGKAIGAGIAAGAIAGTVAIAGMTKVMAEAVELANIQEEAEAKLGAVLEATGNAAGYNLDQLTAMAGAMQGVTTVGDEVTISGMAILATFKQIRGEGFERATAAALDMSAVMKTDLNSSIVQIGKALNDPITGLSSLTRVGVTFTDQQKEQIKTLQESGDMYGAQSVILKELETQFGGTAAAIRETFGGAVDSAQNALGDLKEQIGFTITKNEFFIESVKIAEEVFIGWTGEIKNNKDEMNEFAKSVGIGLVGSIDAAIEVVGFLHISMLKLSATPSVVVDAFAYMGSATFEIVRAMLLPFDALFTAVEKVADYVGNDFINPLEMAEMKIDNFGYKTQLSMEKNFQSIIDTGSAYDVVGQKIDEIKAKMLGLGSAQVKVADTLGGIVSPGSSNSNSGGGTSSTDRKKLLDKEVAENLKASKEITDIWQIQYEERYEIQSRALDAQIAADKEANKTREAFVKEFTSISNAATGDIVSAFVAGEDTKVAVAGIASSYLEQYAIDSATKGLEPIFEAIGSQVGAWVGLGTAQTSTEGESWQQKLATGAGYLAAAGAAVLGAKAVGNSMFAEGGWLGSNSNGGMLTGGSGTKDDLFLGYTDGGMTRNWGMGGEFVVNKEATAKYYPYLEAINSKQFAEGGPVVDAWGPTEDINASGFDTFLTSVIKSKGNWQAAIAESIAYYVGTGAGMTGGKMVGKNLFANGGVVADRKFGFGGFFSDLLDPFDIIENTSEAIGFLDPVGTWIQDEVGGGLGEWIWNSLRDLPIIGESVAHADNILYPFVRDTLTPGKYPDFGTAEDMLKGVFEGIEDEVVSLMTGGGILGSFETGTDYVPKTGPYLLHGGESVITASETANKTDTMEQLRQEVLSANMKIIALTRSIDKRFTKWDKLGMPQTRTA